MSEQETAPEPKTIDVHVTKKRSSLLKYFAVILFVTMLAVLLWSTVFKNYTDYKSILKRSQIVQKEEKQVDQVVVTEREVFTPSAPEIVEQKPLGNIPQSELEQNEILSLKDRLELLEEKNKALTLYIAVRELKEKISQPSDFAEQLEFISEISRGETDIEGRIDLLKQASANGLPTKELLVLELKKTAESIEEKQDKTFWGSVKNSFNGLVKVTKVKGEVNNGDYQAIIKRIELALENSDYKTASTEAEKLGDSGIEFVKKANNLQRVIEITDSLVEFSKIGFTGDELVSEEEML